MHDGTTLIVDVLTLGENSYALSLPAENLWVAYEVVRRHVDANGVRHFSQMVEAKTTSDGYSFKFDTGDTFTCVSHLDKPTSSTLSDTSSELPSVSGADEGKVLTVNDSGVWVAANPSGGVLVVNDTSGTLDKTWQEIHDAMLSVLRQEGESLFYLISTFEEDSTFGVAYSSIVDNATAIYTASSASGYPVRINE